MILYNMRNRGPYEYDKFTLNILQIHNAITLGELHELSINNKERETLLTLQSNIDKLYNELIGENNKIGMCEKIYLNSLKFKEEQ